MNKHRTKILIAVSLGVLALAFCLSASQGQAPVSEVILEALSSPGPEGWEGPATIWVDGEKGEGTVLYLHEARTTNENGWHGVETQLFDFGDLGTLTVSGTAMTTFNYISPEHRWHHYTSHAKITEGTGAFAEAQGVFQFEGFTDWEVDPETGMPTSGYGWGGAKAKIVGIQSPE